MIDITIFKSSKNFPCEEISFRNGCASKINSNSGRTHNIECNLEKCRRLIKEHNFFQCGMELSHSEREKAAFILQLEIIPLIN